MRIESNHSTLQTPREEPGFCAALKELFEKIWNLFFSCCCPCGRKSLADREIQAVTPEDPGSLYTRLIDARYSSIVEEGDRLDASVRAINAYRASPHCHFSQDIPDDLTRCYYAREGLWVFGIEVPMKIISDLLGLGIDTDQTLGKFLAEKGWPDTLAPNYKIQSIHRDVDGNPSYIDLLGLKEAAHANAKKEEIRNLRNDFENASRSDA